MKSFNLFWSNIEIGVLSETNWDMRSSGNIKYILKCDQQPTPNSHLCAFISHSIKASTYLEDGDEDNYNKMCEEEHKFLDLINSSEWTIIDSEGNTSKIICPMFHDKNEITWQTD